MKEITIGISEEEAVCTNCAHYHQHYILESCGSYTQIYVGHCAYPRMKVRKPFDTCKYFENKTPTDAVAPASVG